LGNEKSNELNNINKSSFDEGSSFRKSAEHIIGDFISRNNKIENASKFYKTDKNKRFDSVDELNFENSKGKKTMPKFNENKINLTNEEYEVIYKDKTIEYYKNDNFRISNENKIDNFLFAIPNDIEDNIDYEILDLENPVFENKKNFNSENSENRNKEKNIEDAEIIYNKPSIKNFSFTNDCFKNSNKLSEFDMGNINKGSTYNNKNNFTSSFNLENSKNIKNVCTNDANNKFNCVKQIENNKINYNDDLTEINYKNSNKYLNADKLTNRKKLEDVNNTNYKSLDKIAIKNNTFSNKIMQNEENLLSDKKALNPYRSSNETIKIARDPTITKTEYEKINTVETNYGTSDKNEVSNINLKRKSTKSANNTNDKLNTSEKLKSSSEKNLNNNDLNLTSKFIPENNKNFSQSNGNFVEKKNLDFIVNAIKHYKNTNNNKSNFNNSNLTKFNNYNNINKNAESQHAILNINKESKENDEKTMTCRICLENNIIQTTTEAEERFISPCVCHGTMKHVHESCLKKWIPNQVKKTSKAECEICKSKYKIKFETMQIYSKEKMCVFLEKFFTFIGINCLLIFIVSFVIYSIVVNIVKFTVEEKETFTLIISLSGVAVVLIIIIIILKNYKKHVYEAIPICWTIYEFDSKEQDYEKNISYELFRRLNKDFERSMRENIDAQNNNNSFAYNDNNGINANHNEINNSYNDLGENNNINLNELNNFHNQVNLSFGNANFDNLPGNNNSNNNNINNDNDFVNKNIHVIEFPNVILQNNLINEDENFSKINISPKGAYDSTRNKNELNNEIGAQYHFNKENLHFGDTKIFENSNNL
jgi:hypothetical protein